MRLDGLRVVVTRAVEQAEELAAPLRDLGASVILLPTIGIGPPSNPAPLRKAAEHCDTYDWIIFTSSNGVRAFSQALKEACKSFHGLTAAVGAATCEAAEALGFKVSITPEKFVAESLAEAFVAQNLEGKRMLIPSAAVTRDFLPDAIRQRGATVDVVEAYCNVLPEETVRLARSIFQPPYPDWSVFASPSAVDNLVGIIGSNALSFSKIASIGPVTSEAIGKHRLTVDAEANVSTVTGLIDSIINFGPV